MSPCDCRSSCNLSRTKLSSKTWYQKKLWMLHVLVPYCSEVEYYCWPFLGLQFQKSHHNLQSFISNTQTHTHTLARVGSHLTLTPPALAASFSPSPLGLEQSLQLPKVIFKRERKLRQGPRSDSIDWHSHRQARVQLQVRAWRFFFFSVLFELVWYDMSRWISGGRERHRPGRERHEREQESRPWRMVLSCSQSVSASRGVPSQRQRSWPKPTRSIRPATEASLTRPQIGCWGNFSSFLHFFLCLYCYICCMYFVYHYWRLWNIYTLSCMPFTKIKF